MEDASLAKCNIIATKRRQERIAEGRAYQMTTRRLAAILAADVVGFSAMMERDEEGTLTRLKGIRHDIIEPRVRDHDGRVVKTTGDGFLAEFASPVEAVRCAVEMQHALSAREAHGASKPVRMRIGVILGDILV